MYIDLNELSESQVYFTLTQTVIPRLGKWIARDPAAYAYLIESIRRFPDQEEMKTILERAGFIDVHYKNLSFGIACIHLCARPTAGGMHD